MQNVGFGGMRISMKLMQERAANSEKSSPPYKEI
jgi:hypothetical protein